MPPHLAGLAASGHSYDTTIASAFLLATLLADAGTSDPATPLLRAVAAERDRLTLPPLRRNTTLDTLASRLAIQISDEDDLDFETPSGEELLQSARDEGYSGLLVQSLIAVDAADGCEVVDEWNRRLGPSDVYRRHEASDIGVGVGVMDEMSVYVLLVGVPKSPDPRKRRAAGVAPREYPISDLIDLVDAQRRAGGLPQLVRSPEIGDATQTIAAQLLYDDSVSGGIGRLERSDGVVVLYAKVSQNLVYDLNASVKAWFQLYRADLLRRGPAPNAGGGIATRGSNEHVDGVLAIAIARK